MPQIAQQDYLRVYLSTDLTAATREERARVRQLVSQGVGMDIILESPASDGEGNDGVEELKVISICEPLQKLAVYSINEGAIYEFSFAE